MKKILLASLLIFAGVVSAQNTLVQLPYPCSFSCPPATEVLATMGTSTVAVTPTNNGTALAVISTTAGSVVSSNLITPPVDNSAAYVSYGIGTSTVVVFIGYTSPGVIGVAIYLVPQGDAAAFMTYRRLGNDGTMAQVLYFFANFGFIPTTWIGTVSTVGLQEN